MASSLSPLPSPSPPLLSSFLLLLALSCSLGISSSRVIEYTTEEAKQEPLLQPGNSTRTLRFDPSKAIQLSRHPRVFLYEGFLSDDECEHLISLARGKLEKSMVIDDVTGKSTLSQIRTNSGMFLARGQDDVITRIEERISAWTFLPKENGEDMQILHYGTKEAYKPHYDFYHDVDKLAYGGNRIATVLMYLSNVTRGGETIFPMSEMKGAQSKDDDSWSPCASTGYAVKPVKGNALLFFSLYPNATTDDSSLHCGCMVLEGEKWSATKWIHVRGFDPTKPEDTNCSDEDDKCPLWAAVGECQRNPVYMLGTPDYSGSCRKSCGAC